MLNYLSILLGKFIINFSQRLNLGSGSTWPGHIALGLNPNFIKDILALHPKGVKLKVIIIAGTNGKTTTGRLITSIIRENKKTYLQNKAGSNLINGLASTLIKGINLFSLPRPGLGRLNCNYLIFECDENALPQVIAQTNPDYVICLNLFRDQLDRYGEIDSVARKWKDSFEKLTDATTLILNSDDPQIANLSTNTPAKSLFFGLQKSNNQTDTKHGADSTHCPNCSAKLKY
ncbi:MAG: Mur ligase family protein, partial [Patescibacteria group bacterium]